MSSLNNYCCLKGSISRFSIIIALSTTGLSCMGIPNAVAEDIIYTGTSASTSFKKDPTAISDNSEKYKSLFSQSSYTGNMIRIGDVDAAVQANWNTQPNLGDIIAPYIIYGGVNIGDAGTPLTTGTQNGIAGNRIENNKVLMHHIAYDWSGVTNNAVEGANGEHFGDGGGSGGFGGGSIYGGLSIGGAGASEGTGGFGGEVTNNSVSLKDVTLTGANGGGGGSSMGGGGGMGGIGGASILGGLSIGGTGGFKRAGGSGGLVSYNTVTLTDVALIGANGGSGGFASNSAGGFGGFGGGSVYGGLSMGGNSGDQSNAGSGGQVNNNMVILTNTALKGGNGSTGGFGSIYGTGGLGGGSVYGGLSIGNNAHDIIGGLGGDVNNNTVILTDVALQGGSGGIGSYASTGGIGGGGVYGGLSMGGIGGAYMGTGGSGGTVSDNKVSLTNVTIIGGDGGSSDISGSEGMEGGSIFGGLSIGGGAISNGSTKGSGGAVINNEVSISGASAIWGDIFGGYSTGNVAINNIVTLKGKQIVIGHNISDVMQYGAIWGGKSIDDTGLSFNDSNANSQDIFNKVISGNTLNLIGYSGTVSGIYNFENYNWTLPSDVTNEDRLITISSNGQAVDLTNTKHTIANMQMSNNRLYNGDKIIFITKTQGTWTALNNYVIQQGQFIIYQASLEQQLIDDNKALVLTINNKADITPQPAEPTPENPKQPTEPIPENPNQPAEPTPENPKPSNPNNNQSAAQINPQSKSYSEGRAAMLGFLNQGSDLISTAGIDKIRIMVRANDDNINRPAFIPFMIANGSSQIYNTGSHVDIKGFNMAVGVATGFDFNAGHKATIGLFFEYGHGTYDTYNNFTNFSSVHGDGNGNYKGAGIFGRIDLKGTGLGRVVNFTPDQADGIYLEASIRAGQINNSFNVGNTLSALKESSISYHGSYDSKGKYVGGHGAIGYVFNFDEKQALDVYGRYLWTRMDSDTVSIGSEKLHFDSATSSRIQLGSRYSYTYSEQFKPYIGAAYEHEFNGTIAATAYEFKLDKPSLKGGSGIFEAGFNLQPIANNEAFNINVNGQAFVGQRHGGGGGIKIKYQF
ncbi:autotransporter outer membrane beta-barrel domain-containing protein [Bartonella sp. HY038]|uniref:autotransporter outer membrane beta-barrel domain-containing protein n=1 Tax=Bartonella sp. HY038 TaxID=2759660 RepID=UPI0015FAD8D7|nr:autotransporter outer membrane beta-barrel domain-containing protein [Bartonella sp. HY038]